MLTVDRDGDTVRIHANAFSSAVAARHNEDGTTSFVPLEPGLDWLVFEAGTNGGDRTLITGDSQHTYAFTEIPMAAAK
jgi:hypothetical protein